MLSSGFGTPTTRLDGNMGNIDPEPSMTSSKIEDRCDSETPRSPNGGATLPELADR